MKVWVGYLFALTCLSASAQVSSSVPADIAEKLDAHHLYLDAKLDKSKDHPFAYSDFREAAAHFGDSCTLYIAPCVYWVDDPNTPEVVTGQNGREPFGIVIRAKKLHFWLLSEARCKELWAISPCLISGVIHSLSRISQWAITAMSTSTIPGNLPSLARNAAMPSLKPMWAMYMVSSW